MHMHNYRIALCFFRKRLNACKNSPRLTAKAVEACEQLAPFRKTPPKKKLVIG
jgi:hypothetical protein